MLLDEKAARVSLVKTFQDACKEIKKSRDNIRSQCATIFRMQPVDVKLPDVDDVLNRAYIAYAKEQIILDEMRRD